MSEERPQPEKLVIYGPSRPEEPRQQAILVPRLTGRQDPGIKPKGPSLLAIESQPPTYSLPQGFEEEIKKQITNFFTAKFSDPKFTIDSTTKSTFETQFKSFCETPNNPTYIGQLEKKSLMVATRETETETKTLTMFPSEVSTEAVSTKAVSTDAVPTKSFTSELAKMYYSDEDDGLGPEAVARRKKPNVDLTDDEMQNMFKEWLRSNGIDPDSILQQSGKVKTLICDVERDMDVIQVNGIPTLNGIKSLDLLVPRETPTLGNPKQNDPASNEAFAKNYIEMLILKEEIGQIETGTKLHNRLSSILFRCMLSLVLGYLYNNGLDMLRDAIFTGAVPPEEAKELAFQFVQEQVNDGIIQEGNYTAIGEQYDLLYELLIKENVLDTGFKNYFAPDDPNDPTEQHFETLLEMIVRLANMQTGSDSTPYFKILQGVCFSITLILNKYELITTTVTELVAPYWGSVVHLAAEDSTIMQRLQSIVILAVAYNSYGWLFTVMAPLALPSVLSVSKWALCSLARLPFGIIKFTGKGLFTVGKFFVGYQSEPDIMQIEPGSENTLIQVGWIRKQIGHQVKLIPHMVSKGDVQRLSHYIANHELEKPSLLSSIFNAHGVADHDMQGSEDPNDWAWYLRQSNPIGRFMGCIAEEFAELTVVEGREEEYIPTLEERLFTLVCRTLRNERGDNGFTLIPLLEMWTETLFTKLYETTDETITTINTGIEYKFKDTLLEAIVIMLSSSYVDQTIVRGEIPGSPTLSPTPSSGSDISDISSISTGSRITLSSGSSGYSYKTTDGGQVMISVESSEVRGIIDISLDIEVSIPSLSRTSSAVSTQSDESGIDTLSNFLSSKLRTTDKSDHTIRISKNKSCPRSVPSVLVKDPSALFMKKKTTIFQDLVRKTNEMKEIKKATETDREQNTETIDRLDRLLTRLSTEGPRSTNLSGYLVADAVGSIMNGVVNFSLWLVPPETDEQAGGYRRRNGPILATIGRKIVNNGIYRAIKPKLIASVYGKSKGRQRKRYTKKRGIKKGRKQTTKKIHRKRRSTHKKYKRH